MKKFTQAPLLLMSTLISFSATADEICEYSITRIAIGASGTIRLTALSHPGYFSICNVQNTVNSTSVNTCQGWLSQAHVALTTGKKLEVFYPTGTNCQTHSNNPKPNWIVLKSD